MINPPISSEMPAKYQYWFLVEQLLKNANHPLRELIIKLACFHWFDAETIVSLTRGTGMKADETVEQIRLLPFIEHAGDKGYTYHELFRNAILVQLWEKQRGLYRATASAAVDFLKQAQASMPDEMRVDVEVVYQRFISSPAEALQQFRELMIACQDKGRYDLWHLLTAYGLEHIKFGRINNQGKALVYESAGKLASFNGNRKETIQYLEKALTFYRSTRTNQDGQALLLSTLAWNYNHESQRDRAIRALRTACKIHFKMEYLQFAGEDLFRLGEMQDFNGNREAAYRYYNQSLDVFQKIGSISKQADAMLYMGTTGVLPQDRALELYKQADEFYQRALKDRSEMPTADIQLSERHESAVRVLYYDLFIIAFNHGDCLKELGLLSKTLNERVSSFADSYQAYLRAMLMAEKLGESRWIARTHLRIGDIAFLLGKYDEAMENYDNALKKATKINHRLYIGWAYLGLGDLALQAGNIEQARKYYMDAHGLYVEVDARSNIRDQVVPRLARLEEFTNVGK